MPSTDLQITDLASTNLHNSPEFSSNQTHPQTVSKNRANHRVKKTASRNRSSESGAVMVEYATGLVLIVMMSFALLVSLSTRVNSSDTTISGALGGYPPFLIQP